MKQPPPKISYKTQDPNNYWEQLERLEKLIRASELKAGVVFSFHSLILGIFFDRMEQLKPVFEESIFFIVLCLLWFATVLISIYHCFKCFRPQIETKYKSNVLFFKDAVFAFGDAEEYTDTLLKVFGSEEEFYRQLAQQIHVESKIIHEKFVSVQMAIRFFALSFLFVVLTSAAWVVITFL